MKFCKPDEKPVISIQNLTNGSVSNADAPGYCRISVKDNGIGFDEKYGDKIFSLFQRLNTKDKYEGSGIGLAITKKILDKHNGTIAANSQENIGSEFVVNLPLRQKVEMK